MMSKTLILIISIIAVILIVSVTIFVCCNISLSVQNTKQTYRSVKAVISYGVSDVYTIDVKNYHRISSGWIVVEASDGRTFCTNEENVLLIFEPYGGKAYGV